MHVYMCVCVCVCVCVCTHLAMLLTEVSVFLSILAVHPQEGSNLSLIGRGNVRNV